MIVHPILILAENWVAILPDLTFPDGMTTPQYARYILEEWVMPPEMLEGFLIPADVKIRYRITGISKEGNFAYLFLVPSRAAITVGPLDPHMNADQQEVFHLLQQGMKIKQIAARLRRSKRWVQYRVAEIKHLHNVKSHGPYSRLELAARTGAQPSYIRRTENDR